jgi:hypothetical protein
VIRFLNGPAVGVFLQLRRAPLYLRVTMNRDRKWDALDQPDDMPGGDEVVIAHRRVSEVGTCHVDYTDKQGRRRGAWYVSADYVLCETQPLDEVLRDKDRWAEWATAEHAREQAAKEEPHA